MMLPWSLPRFSVRGFGPFWKMSCCFGFLPMVICILKHDPSYKINPREIRRKPRHGINSPFPWNPPLGISWFLYGKSWPSHSPKLQFRNSFSTSNFRCLAGLRLYMGPWVHMDHPKVYIVSIYIMCFIHAYIVLTNMHHATEISCVFISYHYQIT